VSTPASSVPEVAEWRLLICSRRPEVHARLGEQTPGRPTHARPVLSPNPHLREPGERGWQPRCNLMHTARLDDDRATLTQARSMLILLLAACRQTQTVLEAAANALDTDLTNDLRAMIERTEDELAALTSKLDALTG
jgi:hypothetical protein